MWLMAWVKQITTNKAWRESAVITNPATNCGSLIDLLPIQKFENTDFFEFMTVHTRTWISVCAYINKYKQRCSMSGTFACIHARPLHNAPLTVTYSYSRRPGSKAPWLILFSSSEDLSRIHLCYSCRGKWAFCMYSMYVWVGRKSALSVCTHEECVCMNWGHCIYTVDILAFVRIHTFAFFCVFIYVLLWWTPNENGVPI